MAELRGGAYAQAATFPSAVAERLGSGDAFAGGYQYAWLVGPRYAEVERELGATPLAYGNAVAALKRGIAGDIAVVRAEEVAAVLRAEAGARFR